MEQARLMDRKTDRPEKKCVGRRKDVCLFSDCCDNLLLILNPGEARHVHSSGS